jgi:hypothetical protein
MNPSLSFMIINGLKPGMDGSFIRDSLSIIAGKKRGAEKSGPHRNYRLG